MTTGLKDYKDALGQSPTAPSLRRLESGGSDLRGVAGDIVTEREHRDLRRGLAQRHISMIALAGSIGTGLFLSLGSAIQDAGPLGSLLGYGFIGLIVCAVQFALGEVTALLPVSGSFVRHAEFLTDPALGFALGWNIVYGNWLSVPSEISAICVLFQYWTDLNSSVFIVIFIVLTAFVGLINIRWYGEIEFFFAIIKILLIIGLILLGLIIDLGGVSGVERIGFRYWRNPGPLVEYMGTGSWARFLGFWSVMIGAVFSFAGVESVAMAAAETKNPRQAIPKASATSPFVLAASAAGIKAIPSIVNAVLITSAFSSSNQALLAGTRVLYGLALKGQAPRFFLRTNRWGTPYVCVGIYIIFSFLAFMSLSENALTVFYWLMDLVGCGVLISWSAVLVNHLRLLAALKKQDIPRSVLPWSNWWTPYSSAVALFFCLVILLTNGWEVFTHGGWSPSGFITAYLDIPLVLAAYLIWKFYKKTEYVPLSEIPIRQVLESIDAEPEEKEERHTGWVRWGSWLWD
ncbi:hypothetical protein L202_05875 [Cryptococcus amylolentus CBS 6039]|uniref:Amino acid permease/ SLC12A domain-containing protein n=1 Tax=Cryptococcus amylolentus CBS 6039 TaxID=1295533 RepID=A0A1E3HJI7_9TREE|nr:hypothetical protein L202_05875 [Cryptococcus amylolentus CBS 6039]ODN75886.1 hypothetical protein L202_05875 [Cryptococcus amylolentus CBS 6039]